MTLLTPAAIGGLSVDFTSILKGWDRHHPAILDIRQPKICLLR
jgi:hypothetical protein